MQISVLSEPPSESGSNRYYNTNRAPLLASPLVKLPLGSVHPNGWLKHQLELMAEGMTGRLTELSIFLESDNGWFGGENMGWEEQPYWLRGFYDLAVLTGDARLLEEAHRWIDVVLNSQDADGYFGARYHKRVEGINGQVCPDLWPHMIMLDAVISHYEATADARVIPFMARFFAFCRDLPAEQFLPEITNGGQEFGDWRVWWQRRRAGDFLPQLYWLYNQTGDAWLLDLAARVFQRIDPAPDEWLDHHIVNFTQRFRYPGNFYAQSKSQWHFDQTEYWYRQHLETWGQQPRGIFGADENIRTGCVDPRQGFETCGMVEFAKSFYILARVTGDTIWADRAEDVMLNHFPASGTPDLKGLHYLTASNQPQLDASEKHEYQNKGRMISYSPHDYRCCQHNVAMGWPYYAENLWQASADNGLVAWLYAASSVTARVGSDNAAITVEEKTDYPFSGKVTLVVGQSVRLPYSFPLYLRVPGWCREFTVAVNGEDLNLEGLEDLSGLYVRIEREWKVGDVVDIDMGMQITLTEWPRTGSVSVNRGPLTYSLRIGEQWRRCGGSEVWPEWEVLPTTAWNYGLIVDRDNPAASFELGAVIAPADQPWTLDAAPIRITARGKRIPQWGLQNETVEELQPSPVRSVEPEEALTLIPLGCARLRIACFPTIGAGPLAWEWK
ncbi:MAG: glycoside hydrolase family 127 protein [Chloroflexi bacterium]|nr:glycoside hydrolase family 127 protein [Chloroflexota bacterium]